MKRLSMIVLLIPLCLLVVACSGDDDIAEQTATSISETGKAAPAPPAPVQTANQVEPVLEEGGWWSDIPLFPNVTVSHIDPPRDSGGEFEKIERRTYSAESSPEEVLAFLRDEMRRLGWEELGVTTAGFPMGTWQKNDGEIKLGIKMMPAEDHTTIIYTRASGKR